jgi:uncharacterized protein (DUF927 family)
LESTVSLLDSALYYAKELGWCVFPVHVSKIPAIKDWPNEATTDEQKIRAWWKENPNYNIAILTGERSGIVAMDIDPRNGGTEMLYEKIFEYGALPHTITFKTGGGGVHYIFKHPGWRVKSKGVFEGIDSKGDGGYIVVPPSLHPSGKRYEQQVMTEAAIMPDWWAKQVRDKEPVKGVRKVINKPFPKDKYLNDEIIPEGNRDETLHSIACSMRAYALEESQIYALLSVVNETRCIPPMEDKYIVKISKSAAKHEPGVVIPVDFGGEELDLPVPELNEPGNYKIRQGGIFYTNTKGEIKKIFPIPLAITRRLKNVDTGIEKIELSFYRNNEWIPLIIARSVAFNSSKVVDLSDKSLPISSTNSKDVVRYLTDYEASNLNMLPERCVSRLGWVGENQFISGVDEGIQLDAPHDHIKGYVCSGDVGTWAKNVQPVLQYDVARFMLASSFASPLLKMLKERCFVIYVYGPTRGGKTAATKVALSVWGNPEDTMVSFNSTSNAIEKTAAFLSNLPMGIDERQVVKDQGFVEQLIYLLANGQSKGRLKKDTSPQDKSYWRNIIIATGEDSLTNDSTRGGVVSRTIEIFTQPLPDEELASNMHRKVEEAHGSAGPEFMRRILEEDRESLMEELSQIKNELTKACPDNIGSHISSVSIVVLADYYMHRYFFPIEDFTKMASESVELGKRILGMLQDKGTMDYATRAYDSITSWVSSHRNSFIKRGATQLDMDSMREIFGWIDDKHVYFFKTVFAKMIEELKFSDKSVKQQLGMKGLILYEENGDGNRTFAVKKSHPITNKRERVVVIKVVQNE